MTKRAFGELELQILHILREKGRLTVKEVHKLLGGKDNYNTIMTVMNRLTEKKQLAREKMGLQYEYWVTQQETPSLFAKMKEKFFGVKTSAMVSYLIESAEDLTIQDIEEMEKAIKRAKEHRDQS